MAPGGLRPRRATEVEVRFEAAPAGTRVTVHHRGWDALATNHPARHGVTGNAFTSMIGLRWADALTMVGQLLACQFDVAGLFSSGFPLPFHYDARPKAHYTLRAL